MDSRQGYIKLYRKSLDSPLWKNYKRWHVWETILLLANHKAKRFPFQDKIITVKEGQLLTGTHKISKRSGVGRWVVRSTLTWLEKNGKINQQVTNKFRIITILNWQYYQSNHHQTAIKPPSSRHQTATNKNDKNVKNKRKTNKKKSGWKKPKLKEFKQYAEQNDLTYIDAEDLWHGYNDGGWKDTQGNPVKNWKMKLRTINRIRKEKYGSSGKNRGSLEEQTSEYGETIEC